MKALLAATICLLCLMRTAHAQDKPTIVVNPFKMAPQVSWPYDMKELERQVLAELQNKDRTKFNISADASTTGSHCLTLEVEILECIQEMRQNVPWSVWVQGGNQPRSAIG